MFLVSALTVANLIFLLAAAIFIYESVREQEHRALKFGIGGAVFHLIIGLLILFVPVVRIPILCMFGLLLIVGVAVMLPGRVRKFEGVKEYIKGNVKRFDERDTVFSRDNLSKEKGPEASAKYDEYYSKHPERESRDGKRRAPGHGIYERLGTIDNYSPNRAAHTAGNRISEYLLPFVEKRPSSNSSPFQTDIGQSTHIIKELSKYWGADLVGICRVDPLWNYSNMGDVFDHWEIWGREVSEILPNAVVIATEEDYDLMGTAPHSSSEIAVSHGYGKCAVISHQIGDYLAEMGYNAKVHYFMYNEVLLVPLAVQAGLGELGRFGYLIADKYGSRVRLAAVTTDMPLKSDKPKYLGVDEFCKHCRKCAHACPGRAIPDGEKAVNKGIERWKLDDDNCFEYWYKSGSGCAICTSICVFGRPNRTIHRLVKWLMPRSYLARNLFPYIDNFIYGKKWKTKRPPKWAEYRTVNHQKKED